MEATSVRTPQEVFQHHAEVLIAGDLEGIVADYSEDAVFITRPECSMAKTASARASRNCSPTSRAPSGTCQPRSSRATFCLSNGTRSPGTLRPTTASTRSCSATG